jgi:2-polyprenyl-3-methyl-5-hydroxy-6-metoxy-1,4-benzoquinol methylase
MRLPEIQECENDFQRQFGRGDDVRQFFNPWPRKPGPFSYHLRMDHVLKAFADFLPAPAAVADVACAGGNFALRLAELGYKVTGVDLLEDFLCYARKKYTQGEIHFVQGNLMDYRHPEPLDGLLMGEVIEHVAWPEKLVESAAANLRQGGIFVVTTPNGSYGGNDLPTFRDVQSGDRKKFEAVQFDPSKHLFLYTPEELKGLLEAGGFDLLRIEVFNSHHLAKKTVLRYFFPLGALKVFDRWFSPQPFLGGSSANMMLAVARKR